MSRIVQFLRLLKKIVQTQAFTRIGRRARGYAEHRSRQARNIESDFVVKMGAADPMWRAATDSDDHYAYAIALQNDA